jgi:arylsulfatase A-like enzyme
MDRRHFLKTAGGASLAGALADGAASRPPNVVMIYCDDLGYGDLGCYGSRIPTPNIDRIGTEGIRFTHFYSGNPVCSPSRAALLTTLSDTRGVPRVLNRWTPRASRFEVTIAQMLWRELRHHVRRQVASGAPAALPPHAPRLDEYFASLQQRRGRCRRCNTETLEEPAKLETLTPRYTEQALRFVERSKGSPFFLYLAHTYPHIPLGASDRFRGKSPMGLYGDVLQELDWSTGEIMSSLRSHGLDGNTLVMFSSDNGPWYLGSPGRLRGRKGTTYEGGQRVRGHALNLFAGE